MSHEPPAKCDDPSTWNHKDENIDLHRLLSLVEAHGGSEYLDLHRADLRNLDASPEALEDHARREANALSDYVRSEHGGINLDYVHMEYTRAWQADLSYASLNSACMDNAYFTEANFHGASFWHATLRRALFFQAQLVHCSFAFADLREADFSEADLRGSYWEGVFLGTTRMTPDSLGVIGEEIAAKEGRTADQYEKARKAYLAFKNNFNSLGDYSGASWAHVKERRMGAEGIRRQLDGRQWTSRAFWHTLGQWMLNVVWDVLAGYGETPQKPIGLGVLLAAVFFPLLYWAIGALPGHGAAFTSASPSDIDWAGWGDSLIFSLTSFGTLSFSRLQPEGTVGNLIAAFEAMIGVLLFALFVFTLGNRMSRS